VDWVDDRQAKSSPIKPPSAHFNGKSALASAPGAANGTRHTTATRLIGTDLRTGFDPKIVEMDAVNWAERCEPPFDAREVRQIVQDLSGKDAENAPCCYERPHPGRTPGP
jgi:hypothetical protein